MNSFWRSYTTASIALALLKVSYALEVFRPCLSSSPCIRRDYRCRYGFSGADVACNKSFEIDIAGEMYGLGLRRACLEIEGHNQVSEGSTEGDGGEAVSRVLIKLTTIKADSSALESPYDMRAYNKKYVRLHNSGISVP